MTRCVNKKPKSEKMNNFYRIKMETKDYFYNFICGGFAGATAGFISHPFLRMKIELQNGRKITSNQFTNTKWLMNGVRYGMGCYGAEKLFVFGVYNSLLNHGFNDSVSGALAGLAASSVICPGEKLVIDSINGVKTFKRIDYLNKSIVSQRFGLTSRILTKNFARLYTGFSATVGREVLGFGIHMGVYGYLMKKYNPDQSFYKTIGCVTIAIICGWSSIVPIDRLKTAIQSPNFSWKTYEFSKSFSGFRFALLRAVPFHCTSFSLMVFLMSKKESLMTLEFIE